MVVSIVMYGFMLPEFKAVLQQFFIIVISIYAICNLILIRRVILVFQFCLPAVSIKNFEGFMNDIFRFILFPFFLPEYIHFKKKRSDSHTFWFQLKQEKNLQNILHICTSKMGSHASSPTSDF